MTTTSKLSNDYLKVPKHEDLIQSKPRRAASFIEKPKLINERNPSNLSLPSAEHGILKQVNTPRSSHLNVHYTADNTDRIEFISKVESPTIKNDHHSFEIPRQYTLQKSPWLNPFSRKRSNDENADAYKMVSILYGLVIFIGGVAFSISHAIIPAEEAESIKHIVEIYFTYLYWVSIFWMIFCIFDIVHHKHKIRQSAVKVNKFDNDSPALITDHLRLKKDLVESPLSNDQTTNSPSAPYFNLQLFDDSDEFQSDDNDNEKPIQRLRTNLTKRIHEDDDDDDENFNLRQKSHSLDDLSMKSSIIMRKNVDTARDVTRRRPALDLGGAHNLRTYVRHRKDSIVQRVIGYNYDDHSTAGGLYIRVGIGIFCLGTVIHSGLSILSNMEYLPCARWTAVMDDFSRLLFSFCQFFFVFKHSNLIIRAHESLARLAVMHIVVTNLCVWFRMVVIETKSQIMETGAHEFDVGQLVDLTGALNGTQSIINANYRSHIHAYKCIQSIEDAKQMTTFINEGYMRLKPLLYPCTIEFSLMCLTLFYLIWENIGKTFAHKISNKASTKNVFMVNCHASIKGLFGGMIVFSCTVISIILYAVFRNKIGDDSHSDAFHQNRIHSRSAIITTTLVNRPSLVLPSPPSSGHSPFRSISDTPKKIVYSIAIVEIVNLCLLISSLLATTWALIKIRKLQYRRTTTRFDDVLIIVSLTGTYLYSIFSAFALLNTKHHSTWLAYLKIVIVILDFIEGTIHAFFILVALRKRLQRTTRYQYPAREIITFLIMIDLSLWFEETTTTTKHEANPFQLAFYHVIPWSIIAAIATPLQIFFRFHASVCLSHVWENMYILPAYEPVAPHGL